LNFRKANGAEEPIELIYAVVGHICQLNQPWSAHLCLLGHVYDGS
jgi:hypothetical protein